eukprot:scaffold46026_cov47-Phaeocystis_antarctica.AAC.2
MRHLLLQVGQTLYVDHHVVEGVVERVAHRAAEREGEHECGQQRHVVGELGQDDRERQGHPGHASEHCRGTDERKGASLPSVDEVIIKGELPHEATQQTPDGHSGHEVTYEAGCMGLGPPSLLLHEVAEGNYPALLCLGGGGDGPAWLGVAPLSIVVEGDRPRSPLRDLQLRLGHSV